MDNPLTTMEQSLSSCAYTLRTRQPYQTAVSLKEVDMIKHGKTNRSFWFVD